MIRATTLRDSKGRVIPHSFREAWMITAGWELIATVFLLIPVWILEDYFGFSPNMTVVVIIIPWGVYVFAILPVWRYRTRRGQLRKEEFTLV